MDRLADLQAVAYPGYKGIFIKGPAVQERRIGMPADRQLHTDRHEAQRHGE
jgi:hypothetical protein